MIFVVTAATARRSARRTTRGLGSIYTGRFATITAPSMSANAVASFQQALAEIEPRERHEHEQRDDFLDDLELRRRELPVSEAVGRNLQAVLEEREQPGHEDDLPQG